MKVLAQLTGELDESTCVNVLIAEREQREAAQAADLAWLSLEERLVLARLLSKASGAHSLDALPVPAEKQVFPTN